MTLRSWWTVTPTLGGETGIPHLLTDALDKLNYNPYYNDRLPFDSVSSTTTCFRGFDDGKKLIKMILE